MKSSTSSILIRLLPLVAILFIFILILFRDYEPGTVIMGLDNASNYFFPLRIMERIREGEAFIYSGLLFTAPIFQFFRSVGVSAGDLSWGYLAFNMFSGICGIFALASQQTKHSSAVPAFFSTLLFGTSLQTIWVFSQPNFLFISAYGSIPWIVTLLGCHPSQALIKVLRTIVLAVFTLLFLTTSLNIVAFLLFILQIIILTTILSDSFKTQLETSLLWGIIAIGVFLLSIQCLLFINSQKFIGQELYEYILDLQHNEIVAQVTHDFAATVGARGTFINSARFAGSWMNMHYPDGEPVFEHAEIYNSSLYILLGLLPIICILILNKKLQTYKLLGVVGVAGVFLSTHYVLNVIDYFPLLLNTLRWAESKLWPMTFISIAVLFGFAINSLYFETKKYKVLSNMIILIAIMVSLYHFAPILSSGLITERTKVTLPPEYQALQQLPSKEEVLVIPQPEQLYFREFSWGYYGSDFFSYISPGRFLDAANLYYNQSTYLNEFAAIEKGECPDKVEYILALKSIENQLPQITCQSTVIQENMHFVLMKVEEV